MATITCPKCGSINVQVVAQNKKSFSIGKAVGGALLTGGVGLLAGFAGKKGDCQGQCQSCGEFFTVPKGRV